MGRKNFQIATPALMLDRTKLQRNLNVMAEKSSRLGVPLRPHVKTHKSLDVWRDVEAAGGTSGITVSTLKEADYFFSGGCSDILYAVGMVPGKVAQAASLMKRGCALKMVTDNVAAVGLLNDQARQEGVTLPIFIELDVDGHRSGMQPECDDLIPLAQTIEGASNLILAGVMTHAGESYNCASVAEIKIAAESERRLTVLAAERIRAAGIVCEHVSVGSTPTAVMVDDLSGVTEFRPGVYCFFDLVMAGLSVATTEDIAVSVLATVIGHQPDKGWVITDAGWMAMSRDRGTQGQAVDFGYGAVCDVEGQLLTGVIMGAANQEHGILVAQHGHAALGIKQFPVGRQVRILPNHACATAAQYSEYHVLENGQVKGTWPRIGNW